MVTAALALFIWNSGGDRRDRRIAGAAVHRYLPLIIATMMGAHAALLTPVATPVNLMVLGPGGYRF
jgi:hypothetical protein